METAARESVEYSPKKWLAFFVALYATTAFCGRDWRPELPRAIGGDEPHYLVMLNSVVQDGDLDLGNNYASVRRGGLDAGRSFAGAKLDDQTTWWANGHRVGWGNVFSDSWTTDVDGHPIAIARPGHEDDLDGIIERPVHPPGLAWLLAPFVWPLRSTRFAEPAAILIITLSAIAALLLFHGLVRRFTDGRTALLVTAAAFLGTPIWHYSRTVFAEAPLTLCAVGAAYFIISNPKPLIAGLFLGAGTLMKPPFLLLSIPLAIALLIKRDVRGMLWLALPCILATGAILWSDWIMYGSPWRPPQPFAFGNPAVAAWGLLFGIEHGFLPFAPIGVFAFIGWPYFWRQHRSESTLIIAMTLSYFCVMCLWEVWWGGWCYGPRLIVPIIPLAMIGLAGMAQAPKWIRAVAYPVGIVSIAANFVVAGGVSAKIKSGENPYVTLAREIAKPRR